MFEHYTLKVLKVQDDNKLSSWILWTFNLMKIKLRKFNEINQLTTEILMYDANRLLFRLLYFVHHDYDICLGYLKAYALQSTTAEQNLRNRPQWCQYWVVFRWGIWLAKFEIRTSTNFIISWTFVNFLNFITNSSNFTSTAAGIVYRVIYDTLALADSC